MRDLMVMTQDYTVLPVGTKIGKNIIKICPECKKAGVYTEYNGTMFFVHSEWSGRDDSGHLQVGWVEHVIRGESPK